MNLNPFHEWRPRLFRLLRVIAPEGSSLDAVFGSYSDWKKFRPTALDDKEKDRGAVVTKAK
jgi:hypothetical protein